MKDDDYYKVLGLTNHASMHEVKKAYRRLALKYHPDVNAGGKATENWFRKIHEAYETLSHPAKRANYDQERWYRDSMISGRSLPPSTPGQLLMKIEALARYNHRIDPQRVNFNLFLEYLLLLLDDDNLQVLTDFDEKENNILILSAVLAASRHLNYEQFLVVTKRLGNIEGHSPEAIMQILEEKKRADHWRRFQAAYVLAAAIVLCVIIYFVSR